MNSRRKKARRASTSSIIVIVVPPTPKTKIFSTSLFCFGVIFDYNNNFFSFSLFCIINTACFKFDNTTCMYVYNMQGRPIQHKPSSLLHLFSFLDLNPIVLHHLVHFTALPLLRLANFSLLETLDPLLPPLS